MDNTESEEDLGKFFAEEPDDGIKPIDIGGSAPEPSSESGGDELPQEKKATAQDDDNTEQFLKDELDKPPPPSIEELTNEDRNFAEKGDFLDITEKRPHLNKIKIGAGWDQKNMEEEPVDLDASIFLLNRDGQTREDTDFVFYNQPVTLDGAVKHEGDNRTGAGDGDDESILIDLNGVPFDVMKIMIVLSAYDHDMKGNHLQMVKNIFVRVVDNDDRDEIVRFEIPEELVTTATAMKVAALVREGPRWYFEALAEPVIGGLGKAATEYGLIIQELASTGDDF